MLEQKTVPRYGTSSTEPNSQNVSRSQNLFWIVSHTVGTAMLFYVIDSGPCCNGRRYPAPLNDYCQQSAARPLRGPPTSISLDRLSEGLP
ncbi:hypothetical protein EVAR_49779_1 [Eumeta japonica]|uniref:Uncharacterized protein n=1 Tax=Eumeta variegata TaxID=151549 RepID=A0A4C1Y4D5_EUMVA|nr:hypothetical protein EVAR_49779_1 [Eumeta japonica]